MKNHGYYIASLCEIVRWMGEQADALGLNLFPGFPVRSKLLVDGDRVIGVRTVQGGLDRDGAPSDVHQPPTDLMAKVVVPTPKGRGDHSVRHGAGGAGRARTADLRAKA